MNINNGQSIKSNSMRLLHSDPTIINRMSHEIISWFPKIPREYVVVCIGTDRSTGDALGPLTGTYLAEQRPKHLTIYGSLHEPVHATNLNEYVQKLNEYHQNPFVIAVDACLGKNSSVGHIITGTGSIKPGAALNKSLPEVGDIYLTGVVNVSGFMEYSVLQNTRLSLVVDMAKTIASLLISIDQQLMYTQRLPSIVLSHHQQQSSG